MTSLLSTVQQFIDPEINCPVFADAQITGDHNHLFIETAFPCTLEHKRWQTMLAAQFNVAAVTFTQNIATHSVQTNLKPLANVKNILAVASGKGGVGKSTVAINLAIALQQQGAAVGILDADIYGPSVAKMLGGAQRPQTPDGKMITPIMRHQIQSLSMGDLLDEDSAVIWRGPMLTQTLVQLLRECQWQDLDYLIIDLPPGTGDTQLTLAQQIPVSGALIVTTPQDIALLDVKKAKTMFDRVRIPVLGLVENMSVFHCPHCHGTSYIFGQDGGKNLAKHYDLPLLAALPLAEEFCQLGDLGTPLTAAKPQSPLAKPYQTMAYHVGYRLAQQKKNDAAVFPKIVLE